MIIIEIIIAVILVLEITKFSDGNISNKNGNKNSDIGSININKYIMVTMIANIMEIIRTATTIIIIIIMIK